jgi:hypothetical protein
MRFRNAEDVDLLIEEIGAVSARQACSIADIGLTRLYELIAAGELESYLDGTSRKVTLRSIKARRDRLLEEAKTTPRAAKAPPRPPKRSQSVEAAAVSAPQRKRLTLSPTPDDKLGGAR